MNIASFILYLLGQLFSGTDISRTEVVTVKQGRLLGKSRTSESGSTYFSFQGIPYAKPPIGDLRFVDAKPPEPWDGDRDATKLRDRCPQLERPLRYNTYQGKEDCLFLNVYTPRLPGHGLVKLMPVMFWIHGGCFVFGAGDDDMYNPEYLVSEGVVVVTINYRLGPFGFLYMKEASPGNAGLKDQVAALRWVQENIDVFGGNPTAVTIFGESAGGVSVNFHMISPMSKGLFHRAIAESGSAVNPWAFQRNPEEKTRRLGEAVGCNQTEPAALVKCLRQVDYLSILKATNDSVPTEADRERLLHGIFVPCLEYPMSGTEIFLPELPERLITQGNFTHVPYLTGTNTQETLFTWTEKRNVRIYDESGWRYVDSNWDKNIWPDLRVDPNSTQKASGLEDIREFYLQGKHVTNDSLQQYFDLNSDIEFGEGISFTLRYMAKYLETPLYQYLFNVTDQLNFLKILENIHWPGASHADELGYIFKPSFLPEVENDSTAAMIRRRMVRMWTNFAKFSNPTPKWDTLLNVTWKMYTTEEKNYLRIMDHLIPSVNLYEDRYKFWEDFYSKYT